MKIGFFEIRDSEQQFFTQHLTDHQLYFSTESLNINQLSEFDFEVISTHTDSNINTEVITKFPKLKLIATRTTGVDHIDLAAAAASNIVVTNIPAYGERTVAEYAFALIFALSRQLKVTLQQVSSHNYQTSNLQGFDLENKTIGVIGTGRIGQQLIQIANGLNMTVLAYDAFPNPELTNHLKFIYVDLSKLLSNSDIITLHVPGIKQTEHLINSSNIQQFKKGSILINTARGSVVETAALITALDQSILRGAGLDVIENEADRDNLAARPNVIITPHNAFNTIEAEQRIQQTTIENINNFINGNPTNLVAPPK